MCIQNTEVCLVSAFCPAENGLVCYVGNVSYVSYPGSALLKDSIIITGCINNFRIEGCLLLVQKDVQASALFGQEL